MTFAPLTTPRGLASSARRLDSRSLLLASVAWIGSAACAHAAVTAVSATVDATADASAGVGEVVVTARRRQEDAQAVPIALNAFSGQTLEARRTYNVRDVQLLAPSLVVTVTNPRNTSIDIRGLGNNVSVFNDGLQPAVGVYVDQVYLGRPGQTVFDLSDIASIEVLRGPQGTLFGKDTSAGAVVVSTNAPTSSPTASADVSLGDHSYSQGHLVLNGPIADGTLAGRLSLSQTQHGGFMTNVYAHTRTEDYRDWSGRGELLFTPNADMKWRLTADYGQQRSSTAATVLAGLLTRYSNGNPYPFGYLQRSAAVGYTPLPIDPAARQVAVDGPNSYWEEQGGAALIGDINLPGAVLTSVTSGRVWNWSPHNDGDGTSAPAGTDFHQANQQSQFSQELRIASSGRRTLDYVAGVYGFWQTVKAQAVSAYGPLAAQWFVAPAAASPAAAAAALDNYTIQSRSSPKMASGAVFAETIWHATPRFDVTTGLRYTYEAMSGYFNQTATGASLSALSASDVAQAQALRARFGTANSFTAKTSDGALTGRLSLSYRVTDDVLAYATYARGYKAGGLNLSNIKTVGALAANPVVGPETLDTYEAGFKSSWFDHRLTANADLFWTNDRNYQTTQTNLINGVTSLTNAGQVRSRGVEVDLQARPVDSLNLYVSATYDDAIYLAYKNAPCAIEIQTTSTCDLSGRQLPGPSKWALSGGGEYDADIGAVRGKATEAYVGGDYSYRSAFYTTSADSIYSLIPGYGVLNVRAGVRAKDGTWDFQVWSRNATDSLYYLSLSAANTGAVTGTLGDPRTVGATLRVKY